MVMHADGNSKRRIAKEVGIPICEGAAPTKTLAKLYNKKAKEHGGVFVYNPAEVDGLLESVDCGTIWGIGPDAYGRHSITLAKSWTVDGWQMKREFLSPCVTTDILVVPGVK